MRAYYIYRQSENNNDWYGQTKSIQHELKQLLHIWLAVTIALLVIVLYVLLLLSWANGYKQMDLTVNDHAVTFGDKGQMKSRLYMIQNNTKDGCAIDFDTLRTDLSTAYPKRSVIKNVIQMNGEYKCRLRPPEPSFVERIWLKVTLVCYVLFLAYIGVELYGLGIYMPNYLQLQRDSVQTKHRDEEIV